MPDAPVEGAGDWSRTFTVIRRRWWVVLLCLVVGPVVAYAYSQTQGNKYQATATTLVSDPAETSALALAGLTSLSTNDDANALGTDAGLASLSVVAHNTARALGRRGLPGSVTTNNNGASNLLTVTATESSPILAADIANAYAHQYIVFQTRTNLAHIASEAADLTRALHNPSSVASAGATVASVTQSLGQLATLASLQSGNVQVINAATPPSSPSSPKTKQIVVAGAVIGLLLGILFAVVLGQLDRRLWSSGDIEEILQGPILGKIPRSRLVAHAWSANLSDVEQESFAMLYANISHSTDRQVRSVLVTSAAGGEGKSTVSLNLAAAAARAGARVLLIEADLRYPVLASRIGVEADADTGLADVLAGDVALAEVTRPIPLPTDAASQPEPDHEAELVRADGLLTISRSTDIVRVNGHRNGPGARITHIDIVFAGRLDGSGESGRMSPFRLLASDEMRDLILATERTYDLVVIDTPPMSVVSDAIPLMKYASGVLVVSRVEQNTRESARRLRDQLNHLRVRTLGVVVNGVGPNEGDRGWNSTDLAES